MFITINGKDYNVHIIQSVKKEECALKYNISNGNILIEEFNSNAERDEKYEAILDGNTVTSNTSSEPSPGTIEIPPEPIIEPSENYTLLRSIIAHGTERIDTGIIPNDPRYGFKVKFSISPSAANRDWNILNMGGYSVDDYRFGLGGYSNDNLQPAGIKMNGYIAAAGIDYNEVHTFDFNYNHSLTCLMDGVNLTSENEEHMGDDTDGYTYEDNWNIFCQTFNDNGTGYDRFFRGNLYYLEIFLGTELVRCYIPVLDSNGVPCLYDTVNETYNYNSGTGNLEYETLGGEE